MCVYTHTMYARTSVYTTVRNKRVLYHWYNNKLQYFLLYRVSGSIALLYVELCLGDKANWSLSPKTKFHIQKYDGLENIEKQSRALEVTLDSSTDTNLDHNHTKI